MILSFSQTFNVRHPELDSGSMRFYDSLLRGRLFATFQKVAQNYAGNSKSLLSASQSSLEAKQLAHDENRRCVLLRQELCETCNRIFHSLQTAAMTNGNFAKTKGMK